MAMEVMADGQAAQQGDALSTREATQRLPPVCAQSPHRSGSHATESAGSDASESAGGKASVGQWCGAQVEGEWSAQMVRLSALTVVELRASCRQAGVRGFSALRKKELVEMLCTTTVSAQ